MVRLEQLSDSLSHAQALSIARSAQCNLAVKTPWLSCILNGDLMRPCVLSRSAETKQDR